MTSSQTAAKRGLSTRSRFTGAVIEAPRCKQGGMFCLSAVLRSTVRNFFILRFAC